MMRIPFSYIWRSLWARRLTTALTIGGVALVVFVFAGVLMLARGLEATLVETGSPDNAIVLRRSAGSELVSQIDRGTRSEEHTSELQSQSNLVCRLLLEKKKRIQDSVPDLHRQPMPTVAYRV